MPVIMYKYERSRNKINFIMSKTIYNDGKCKKSTSEDCKYEIINLPCACVTVEEYVRKNSASHHRK